MNSTMLQVSGASQRDRIGSAIARASAAAGVDFGYMLNQAKVESGLDPNARARTSSATGLYQFLDQTWLATVKEHGDKHGLGWAAGAISQGSDGRYRVSDPATRRAVLDLRRDPEAAAGMAAEFAADNRDHLEAKLGRDAEPVDLYLAHFLGAGGATRFLSAHDANPDAPAAAILPAAARANRSIFYERDGSARSFAEIRDRFAAKINADAPPPATNFDNAAKTRMASLETPFEPIAAPSAQYARLAYMMLADLGA